MMWEREQACLKVQFSQHQLIAQWTVLFLSVSASHFATHFHPSSSLVRITSVLFYSTNTAVLFPDLCLCVLQEIMDEWNCKQVMNRKL